VIPYNPFTIGDRVVVLVSGGLESAVLLYHLKNLGYNDIYAITFNYGQKSLLYELAASKRMCETAGVSEHLTFNLDMSVVGRSALTADDIPIPHTGEAFGPIDKTYVPARNLVFLSIAAGWAEVLGASFIVYGANGSDRPPDSKPEFIEALNRTLSCGLQATAVEGKKIEVVAPLSTYPKTGVVQLGYRLGVKFEDSVTCCAPVGPTWEPIHCGECDDCLQRRQAFKDNEIHDPTLYLV